MYLLSHEESFGEIHDNMAEVRLLKKILGCSGAEGGSKRGKTFYTYRKLGNFRRGQIFVDHLQRRKLNLTKYFVALIIRASLIS